MKLSYRDGSVQHKVDASNVELIEYPSPEPKHDSQLIKSDNPQDLVYPLS